jgi:hypothetical protein
VIESYKSIIMQVTSDLEAALARLKFARDFLGTQYPELQDYTAKHIQNCEYIIRDLRKVKGLKDG